MANSKQWKELVLPALLTGKWPFTHLTYKYYHLSLTFLASLSVWLCLQERAEVSFYTLKVNQLLILHYISPASILFYYLFFTTFLKRAFYSITYIFKLRQYCEDEFRVTCIQQFILTLTCNSGHLIFSSFTSLISSGGIFGYAVATGLGLLAARVLPLIPCLWDGLKYNDMKKKGIVMKKKTIAWKRRQWHEKKKTMAWKKKQWKDRIMSIKQKLETRELFLYDIVPNFGSDKYVHTFSTNLKKSKKDSDSA